MGFIEESRQLIQDSGTREILSIDARLTVLEKKMESLEGCRADRNHAQIMETLHRMESRMLIHIQERLARLEGKMQHVA